MNKYFLSPYVLSTERKEGARKGYLLKVESSNFSAGYADIHPWNEFGDPSWSDIPELIKKYKVNVDHFFKALDLRQKKSAIQEDANSSISMIKVGNEDSLTKIDPGASREESKTDVLPAILQKSLLFARRDGWARAKGEFLNEEITLTNHYTITDLKTFNLNQFDNLLSEGFCRIKIKVGRGQKEDIPLLEELCMALPKNGMIRLDFNGLATQDFLNKIIHLKDKIEFIEDPFAKAIDWRSDWDFAYDQPSFPLKEVSVNWQIIKPAKQLFSFKDNRAEEQGDWQDSAVPAGDREGKKVELHPNQVNGKRNSKNNRKYIFTSYLDHPVGIAHAFYEASLFGKQINDYGLMTHKNYQENEFYESIQCEGPKLSFMGEKGIGFDQALKNQRWLEI